MPPADFIAYFWYPAYLAGAGFLCNFENKWRQGLDGLWRLFLL